MPMTHDLTFKWNNDQALPPVKVSNTSDGEVNLDVTIPPSSTDLEIDVNFEFANMKSLYLLAKSGAMTLETNSSSSPVQTIALAADKPLVWYTGSGITNPITANVTKFYITSTPGGTFQMRLLLDA